MDWRLFIFLLALINPFIQVLYLWDLLQSVRFGQFAAYYAKASLFSLGVFVIVAIIGQPLLVHVFQISLDSMRIFGGLIILLVGLKAVMRQEAGSLIVPHPSETPLAIALPYLIGPGTVWICILIGQQMDLPRAGIGLAVTLGVNLVLVLALSLLFDRLRTQHEKWPIRFLVLLMRTNALFIGGIGVDMILRGLAAFIAGPS